MTTTPSVKNFVNFYKDKYVKIYSDLTSFVGVKPTQLLIENENINAHLVVYLSDPKSQTGKDNLTKAHNHLVRCTIDASKMLWIEMKKHLDNEFKKFSISKYSYNLSESEFLRLYNEFLIKGQEARKSELQNVGISPESCIESYYNAINCAWEIIQKHDKLKSNSFVRFRVWNWIKSNVIQILASFFIGVFASCISINMSLIKDMFWKIFPLSTANESIVKSHK
ncbi:hypothetical protein LEP1GSC060_3428 [Leptospira weilii serovar Ranarum str. ICFT]|uniref:Uncharacterized protein n=1 Tax=Leptospira weilii serovar Ranarum str. ICFT TaxID=1218598 RepID=N1W9K8_9LEPT|nr:hypothetical protein [Leptospira weilii]EMY76906.1 hypothetical protein LEP1GSC060_3428 [Leptospira weilii serovar Ranarum str. ICFT]